MKRLIDDKKKIKSEIKREEAQDTELNYQQIDNSQTRSTGQVSWQ